MLSVLRSNGSPETFKIMCTTIIFAPCPLFTVLLNTESEEADYSAISASDSGDECDIKTRCAAAAFNNQPCAYQCAPMSF